MDSRHPDLGIRIIILATGQLDHHHMAIRHRDIHKARHHRDIHKARHHRDIHKARHHRDIHKARHHRDIHKARHQLTMDPQRTKNRPKRLQKAKKTDKGR
jgi:hypothetical protein